MAIELIALAAGAAFLFALLMAAVVSQERKTYLDKTMSEIKQLVDSNNIIDARGRFEVKVAREYLHQGGASGRIHGEFMKDMGNYAVQTGLFEAMMKRNAIPQGVSPETYIQESVHNVVNSPLIKRISPDNWESAWTKALDAGSDRKALDKVSKHFLGARIAKEISDHFRADMEAYNGCRWAPHERTETARELQERRKQEAYNKRKNT